MVPGLAWSWPWPLIPPCKCKCKHARGGPAQFPASTHLYYYPMVVCRVRCTPSRSCDRPHSFYFPFVSSPTPNLACSPIPLFTLDIHLLDHQLLPLPCPVQSQLPCLPLVTKAASSVVHTPTSFFFGRMQYLFARLFSCLPLPSPDARVCVTLALPTLRVLSYASTSPAPPARSPAAFGSIVLSSQTAALPPSPSGA